MLRSLLLVPVLAIVAGGAWYAYPGTPLPAGTRIDSLRVYKSERRMDVYAGGGVVKTYWIALGQEPVGDKQYQGDMRTPEGRYTINDKNPNSGYHKNLGISYPNDADRKEARALGKSPGGDIKIHGLPNGRGYIGKLHRQSDWTWGCIAVTDEEVDELYEAVPIGTPIEIRP
ncbi:MAG: L,D-transpeptidase family protein [Flavobacteriales bacterium]|nr:L,D-transpeptidase family protein [Flavobacteriales bacterium]